MNSVLNRVHFVAFWLKSQAHDEAQGPAQVLTDAESGIHFSGFHAQMKAKERSDFDHLGDCRD